MKFDINLLDGNVQINDNNKAESSLQIIEENSSEIFAVPKVKHSNSIIR